MNGSPVTSWAELKEHFLFTLHYHHPQSVILRTWRNRYLRAFIRFGFYFYLNNFNGDVLRPVVRDKAAVFTRIQKILAASRKVIKVK